MRKRTLYSMPWQRLARWSTSMGAALVAAALVLALWPTGAGFAQARSSISIAAGTCASPETPDPFLPGDVVLILGENFAPDTYDWNIMGLGGSADPNTVVASSQFTVDDTGSFCFPAYTVQGDDRGPYRVTFGPRTATYRVQGQRGPTPTATSAPPTATAEPPTATPEPPTATPEPPTPTSEPPTATPTLDPGQPSPTPPATEPPPEPSPTPGDPGGAATPTPTAQPPRSGDPGGSSTQTVLIPVTGADREPQGLVTLLLNLGWVLLGLGLVSQGLSLAAQRHKP